MDSWHSYGKVFTIGHRDVLDVFKEPVVVQEKVDGSYIGFGVYGGELKARSRSKELILDAPEKLFEEAATAIKGLSDKLHEGWMYHGEYLRKPKHNTLSYIRHPENHIILFDVATGNESFLGPEELAAEAKRIGLEAVPLLYTGVVESKEQLQSLLDTTSILGGQRIEGVVCKNYSRTTRDGKSMKAKLVRDSFKEAHNKVWKKQNPTGRDILEMLGDKYRCKSRWDKTIFRLRDTGSLQECVSDIGPLIHEIKRDIQDEESEAIKDQLYDWAIKHIARKAVAGFPEYYKETLVKKQFAKEVS